MSDIEIIFIGIVVVLWLITGTIFEVDLSKKIGDGFGFVFPRDIYDNTPMNWFGTIFCYILLSIFSILLTWVKIGCFVGMLIYEGIRWLFTVGKGKKETDEDE